MNKIQEFFKLWCKRTKRSGGILIGSSVREFLSEVEEINKRKVHPDAFYDRLMSYNRWSKNKHL